MPLSSFFLQKTAASAFPWKAVSVVPRRAFVALAARGAGSLVLGGVRTHAAPVKPPRQVATPFFFFSSGVPSLAARKPSTGKAAAKTAAKKPRTAAKAGPKAKKKKVVATARKSTVAKSRVGARKAKIVRPARLQAAKAKARVARARAQAKAKSVKAQAKARSIKVRAAAKAKAVRARQKEEKAQARLIQELKRSVPKRVSSPLSLFYSDNAPGGSVTQGIKVILDTWKNAPGSTKQAYKEKAQANSESFGSAMERWLGGLTPEQKKLVRRPVFLKTLLPYKARAIRRVGRKHTPSSYTVFIKTVSAELRAKVQRDQPDLAGKHVQIAAFKLAAAKWRALSAEQKKVYAAV